MYFLYIFLYVQLVTYLATKRYILFKSYLFIHFNVFQNIIKMWLKFCNLAVVGPFRFTMTKHPRGIVT